MSARFPFGLALAALACVASSAYAGGPLGICNQAPLKYSPGAVTLNYDQGTLGGHTKAQADAIVNSAIALWNNVGTATITISRGSDMPVDVTLANYSSYSGNLSDGLSPVIYDSDGSIIGNLFGAANVSHIIGFAGSGWFTAPTCRYAEGDAVMNGAIAVSDTTMTVAMAHEFGHLIGLDHTQLDSSQLLTGANYPLMYPIAFRATISLGEDDLSAVSALYPDATVATTYGTLQGNLRLADGVTAVLGANVWAQDVSNVNRVYSMVSDFLTKVNGGFKMLLPPGTYTLHAEAIDSQFTGGSSVGPYSDTSFDHSFQSPIYSGSTPMAPLTLGNASPTQFTITAGCTATADFRFNGTGSVIGNCGTVATPVTRLTGISTRMQVLTGGNVLIGGFVIGGSTPKTVVINARGPSMAAQGVPGVLANPTLTLVPSSGPTITNDDWVTAPYASQLTSLGLAPPNSLESSILATLNPGAYTAIVSGAGGTTGVGIVEVFEVDHPEIPLAGIATRGEVLTGGNVMIGGFIIQGSTPQTVIVRARGPSLASQGISGVLANPTLQLFSGSTVIASNDNWGSAPNAAQVSASGFAPSDPNESAILITLNPGAYTAIVSGVGGTTGIGIVEVYAQ